MIRSEIFGGIRKPTLRSYCKSPQLRGKIDGFLRDGNRAIINQNQDGSRCDICVQTVGSAGSAGPCQPAAQTDSDDFFFLELATSTPTGNPG
jgi:hypothetical protein